jgi:hypothetical protein
VTEKKLNSEQRLRANVIHGRGPDDDPPRKSKGATYYDHAASEAGLARGRFTAREKSEVIGAEPVRYPRLPETSPWATEPVGQEPPLGLDVNAVEPCGTYFEIQQSIERSGASGCPPCAPDSDGVRSVTANAPVTSQRRRRSKKRMTSK